VSEIAFNNKVLWMAMVVLFLWMLTFVVCQAEAK